MLNFKPIPPKFPETYCNCAECRLAEGSADSVTGRRVPQPMYHDCRHIFEQSARVQAVAAKCSAAIIKKYGEPPPAIPKEARNDKNTKAVNAREDYINNMALAFNRMFTREMEKPVNVISFNQ